MGPAMLLNNRFTHLVNDGMVSILMPVQVRSRKIFKMAGLRMFYTHLKNTSFLSGHSRTCHSFKTNRIGGEIGKRACCVIDRSRICGLKTLQVQPLPYPFLSIHPWAVRFLTKIRVLQTTIGQSTFSSTAQGIYLYF